jgi:hypothetical protein
MLIRALQDDLKPLLGTGPADKTRRQEIRRQIQDLEASLIKAFPNRGRVVNVTTLDGNEQLFSFRSCETIKEVKKAIERKLGIKPWHQVLTIDSYKDELRGKLKLADITQRRTLHMSCIVDKSRTRPLHPDLFKFWGSGNTLAEATTSCACSWRFVLAGDVQGLAQLLAEIEQRHGADGLKAMLNACHEAEQTGYGGRGEGRDFVDFNHKGNPLFSLLHAAVIEGLYAESDELTKGYDAVGREIRYEKTFQDTEESSRWARAGGKLQSRGLGAPDSGQGGGGPDSGQGGAPDFLGVLRLLLESGADPNLQNESGSAALHAAVAVIARNAFVDRGGLVKELIAAGADVNLVGYHGMTALHAFAANFLPYIQYTATCREILAAGAQCDVYDDAGHTPLYHGE